MKIYLTTVSIIIINIYSLETLTQVEADLFCDDYCSYAAIGEEIIINGKIGDVMEVHHISKKVKFGMDIVVIAFNEYLHFGFTGYYNFRYFKVSTNNEAHWIIKDDECARRKYPGETNYINGQYNIGIKNNDNAFNYKYCNFTYHVGLCKNEKFYLEDDRTVTLDGFLDVEPGDYIDKLRVKVEFPYNIIGTYSFNIKGIDTSTKPIDVTGPFDVHYHINQRYIVDNIYFPVIGEKITNVDDDVLIYTCTVQFIPCGLGCIECDENNDFKCLKCKDGFAFLEGNSRECVLKIDFFPLYYFVPEDNKYYRCYDSCYQCSIGGTKEEHNCKQCLDSFDFYYLKGDIYNCYSDCGDKFKFHDTNQCIDTCDFPLYIHNNVCFDTCPAEAPYLIENDNHCLEKCEFPNNFIYNEKTCVSSCKDKGLIVYITSTNEDKCVSFCPNEAKIVYHTSAESYCVDRCEGDNKYELTDQICVESCPGNKYVVEGDNKCLDVCPDGYYKYGTTQICVLSCKDDFPLTDIINTICVNTCPINQILYNNQCVKQCPNNYILVNNTCQINLYLVSINTTYSEITLDVSKANSYIQDNILIYLKENKTLIGNDYIVEIYKTSINNSVASKNEVSSIQLTQCEKVLKRYYDIPEEESLIIIKYDHLNYLEIVNQVEYKVYNKDGKLLNLNICEGLNVNISIPINDIFNLAQGEKFYQKGIDIYNPYSDYYNDICVSYTEEGPNIISKRRKEYKDIPFCESHCNYLGIDYNTRKVNCECSIIREVYRNKAKLFEENYQSSVILILKCYNLVFNFSNLKYNIGFWLFLSLMLLQFIFVNVIILRDKNILYSSLNCNQKSSPSVHNDYDNSQYAYIDDETEKKKSTKSLYSLEGPMSSTKLKMKDSSEEENNKDINDNRWKNSCSNQIIEKERNNYEQIEKILNKSYLRMFWEQFKCLHYIITKRVIENKLLSKGIIYSLFILYISVCFPLNQLLFTDDIIIDSYNKVSLLFSFITLKLIFTILFTIIILSIIKQISFFPRIYHWFILKTYQYNKNNLKLIRSFQGIKFHITFYIIIVFINNIFFWYSASLFCIVYSRIQIKWVIESFICILILIVLDLLICIILATIRIVGIKHKCKGIINFELIFNDIN